MEITSDNVANSSVPAYKRRVPFSTLVRESEAGPQAPAVQASVDLRPGKLVETGSPYDLALAGPGSFAFQDEGGIRFSRAGRFTRRGDGRLADVLGGVLLSAAGGEVVVEGSSFEVRSDGRITSDGLPSERVGVWDTSETEQLAVRDRGLAEHDPVMAPAEAVHVVQGFYEASNVSTAEEMVQMMQALRQAEAGQRVMIAYDDIMGRVISTFGESVR